MEVMEEVMEEDLEEVKVEVVLSCKQVHRREPYRDQRCSQCTTSQTFQRRRHTRRRLRTSQCSRVVWHARLASRIHGSGCLGSHTSFHF